MIATAPYTTRDLMFGQPTPDRDADGHPAFPGLGLHPAGATAEGFTDHVERRLPEVLAGAVAARWGAVHSELGQIDGDGVSTDPDGAKPAVSIGNHPDLTPALRIVEGRAPDNRPGADKLEAMVAVDVARTLGLRLDQEYLVKGHPVRLVGLFEANDPTASDWDSHPTLLRTSFRAMGQDTRQRIAAILTDRTGIEALREQAAVWGLRTTARFRLDERRLHAGHAASVRDAVRQLHTDPRLGSGVDLQTRLDDLISAFERQQAAVRALIAVVATGVLGTTLGLLVIAARLAVDRRRAELRLLRARGASRYRLVRTVGVEALAVVLPAVAAGWLLHHLVPGRPDPPSVGTLWPVAAAALLAVAAVPLAVLVTRHDATTARRRTDLILRRPAPRRVTAEVTVLLLAVLGVLLLRRRGLAVAGSDPYLSAVPLLIGAAAGLVALRAYPWPLRLLSRLSNRRRGPVAFLGLARAGRHATAFALPLVVLVLAVSLAGFASAVRGGVADARGAAAALEVGADFRLTASAFAPGAEQAVAEVPGVRSVLAARHLPDLPLRIGNTRPDGVSVVAVDPARYQRLLDAHGLDLRLPPALLDRPGSGPVPVAASPTVAALFTDSASLTVGDTVPVRLAGTVERLPGLDAGRDAFVLVAVDAIDVDVPVTTLLVTGAQADPAALARAAAGSDGEPAEMTSLDERRRALQESEFNPAITLAFGVGLVVATVGALLAVMLALVTEARTRGRVLSLLRTMGLSYRQARAMLLVELTPLVATALLVGVLVGAVLPLLLAPALGLSAFTDGIPLRLRFDPLTVGVVVGLAGALLTSAVLTEAWANRRLGLGQVLRVGTD
jgi:putative ABC transport system permease protein